MITKFKIFEQIEDIDPYGEEDWNYEEKFIRLRLIFDGNEVHLKYKEIKYEEIPSHVLDYMNRSGGLPSVRQIEDDEWAIIVKKITNSTSQTQLPTLFLLKILDEKNKEIIKWARRDGFTNVKESEKNLFMNILKLNSKIKPLMGMMDDEWFDYLKQITEEE